jgi:hypothetical protein
LISSSKTSGTRTNNSDLLAGTGSRRVRNNPAFVKTTINDSAFDALDSNSGFVDG